MRPIPCPPSHRPHAAAGAAALLMVLTLAPGPAGAEAEEPWAMPQWLAQQLPVCLTRAYSDQHLAETPHQTVREMTVLVSQPLADYPVQTFADVSVRFRDDERLYTQVLFCSTWEGKPQCSVGCDGGNFTLEAEPGRDTMLLRTQGFVASGSCGEAAAIDGEAELPSRHVQDQGDSYGTPTVFRLNRAPLSSCWTSDRE